MLQPVSFNNALLPSFLNNFMAFRLTGGPLSCLALCLGLITT